MYPSYLEEITNYTPLSGLIVSSVLELAALLHLMKTHKIVITTNNDLDMYLDMQIDIQQVTNLCRAVYKGETGIGISKTIEEILYTLDYV